MDLLPTFCSLAGIDLLPDRIFDGGDLTPVLRGTGKSPRDTVFYYLGVEVWGVRHGNYKMHLKSVHPEYGPGKKVTVHNPPLLYDLANDIGEKKNIAAGNAEVIKELRALIAAHRKSVKPVPNQLERG